MPIKSILISGLAAITLSSVAHAQRDGGRGSATAIQPGETCPPGMTEIRPRSCMPPELAPPSIVDYRPHSTLVAPVHMKPMAKYPAIDFHGHPQGRLGSAEALNELGSLL